MRNQNKKCFRSMVSVLLAIVMVISMVPMSIFAATTVEKDNWTIVSDAEAKTYLATDTNTGLVYKSPTEFTVGTAKQEDVTRTYVRSASNGSFNSNDQTVKITDSTRAWCEYVPEKDGTLRVYVGKANTKTGYISRTDSLGKSQALGTFVPCGSGDFDNDYLTVEQGTNWATIDIEVEQGYTYYICLNGSKMICYGSEFIPYTVLTGEISDEFNLSSYEIKFTNAAQTGKIKSATVNGKTYSIALKPNNAYLVSLVGENALNYAISPSTKRVTVVEKTSGTQTHNLTIERNITYTATGSVKGIAEGYDLSDAVFILTPADLQSHDVTTATFDVATKKFTANLIANETYTLSVEGIWDYKLAQTVTFENDAESPVNKDVAFNACDTYDVSGNFIGLTQVRGEYEELNVNPTKITFTNISDEEYSTIDSIASKYVYNGSIADAKYSAKLRNGSYLATIVLDGYTTTTHVVVNNGETTRNILLKPTGEKTVEYKDTIYVGADKEYKSIYSAVEAVKNMPRPNGERVTIKIDVGTYREQLYIDTPNITFESNGGTAKDTIITSYYGIGYKYYSIVDSKYDPYNEYDKFNYGNVTNYWGGTVITTANAKGFKAKDITFENSFNKYMTKEEIADGVAPSGLESINVARKINTIVDSKVATERAGALTNYADQVEFLNCKFIGSQDTLYTSNKVTDGYFKNCYIEGQTDFIYGNGNMIFDGCEINFCGYSDTTSAGYLTAQSANATKDGQEASGYVFRNCFISYNKDRKVTPGSWGRMWGANCTVAFLNTQLEDKEMILNPGWVAMSGNDPTSTGVNLVEYNTTYCGEAVDTTGRVAGTVVNAIDINDYSVETIFADRWTPTYYTGDVTTAPEFKTKPALTSNGDLNAPNPGETVTVVYEFGDDWKDEDASQIIWYAVPENSDLTSLENILKTAVVLKSTSASISNSFQIPMECAGNYIMAVVIPVTNNGMKNTAEYALRTEKVVSNVWTDPTGETPIAPGSGINIYLAGDSTVKDYSIKGMYNGGKILNEGSWGEYLQEFFDAEFVTINNYAQGGRATRSFINEGKLDNILKNIKKGDYLFIQFGHNDCSNGTAYYLDRFVPLYTADNPATESGYPTIVPTESMRTATPDALKNNILSSTYYAWDCGATYKGFLQYYIDRALEKEAIPVVVSPVSRTYFDDNGKIRAHHDSNATDCELTKNLLTSNNAYATACEEIYNENKDKGVLYLDAFNITKSLYEKAYSDTGSKQAVSDIMSLGDSTHSSKTGGVIQAGLIAEWIKNNNLSISKYVKAPTSVYGEKPDGEFIFEIDENGKFKAKNNDYAVSDYWTSYGQALFETLDVAIEETTTETTTEITTETTTETTTEPSTEMVKYGDVDSDGDIDANDAARTLSYVRNKDLPLTLREIVAAKLGFDKVTATNAAMILKKAKNLDYNFPNGESGNIEKDPAQLKEITLLH